MPEEKYEEQKSLERYELEKQTKLLIKLPEKARQFVIKLPEVCWRSARGVVDWIVAAPSTYKGWLLEVCPRSAGGVEAIRDRAAGRGEAVLRAAGGVEAIRESPVDERVRAVPNKAVESPVEAEKPTRGG